MENLKLSSSILAIAIIWGTTFLGIRIAVETIPPIYVTGIRHLLSAIILLIYLTLSKNIQWIGWANFKIQIILHLYFFYLLSNYNSKI